LHELLPGIHSISVLTNPTNPTSAMQIKEIESAAQTLGLRLAILQASNPDEIDAAFARFSREGFGALMVSADRFFFGHIDQLVALAARYRIPAIYRSREFVEAGGLMSYGSNFAEAHRIAGNYAARVLKGEKPSDLPVQLSTRIEMVLNLKTGKALGLDVPTPILLRADEVFE
jgi:putative ABC transport system substrate-binding protein